jgi:hypothetical protein
VITDDIAAATAEHLGILIDPRVTAAAEATVPWVQRYRSLTPPAVLWSEPNVVQGAVLYAAHLYNVRAAPSGTDMFADPGASVSVLPEVYRLIGSDPVIA